MTPPATAARHPAASHPATRRSAARRVPVRHPRRISGPARAVAPAGAPLIGLPAARPRRRPAQAPGVASRVIDAVNGASNSALLDRLIRSRLWIGVLAFLLIGIVAMQLLVFKLNTQVGRVLAREATLQRENTSLRIADASASSGSVVEPAAAAAGMTVAAPGSLHFVGVSAQDIGRAADALRAAVPTQLVSESVPTQTVPTQTSQISTVSTSTVPTSTVSTSTVPTSTIPTSTVPTSTAQTSTAQTSTVLAQTAQTSEAVPGG